jgi:hypothetical protein
MMLRKACRVYRVCALRLKVWLMVIEPPTKFLKGPHCRMTAEYQV